MNVTLSIAIGPGSPPPQATSDAARTRVAAIARALRRIERKGYLFLKRSNRGARGAAPGVRAIVVLLCLHAIGIALFGLAAGYDPLHSLAEGGGVAVAAAL